MSDAAFDRDDPPVLGANPFVGLSGRQVAAAFGRLGQRVAVEPGAAIATAVDAGAELVRVAIGRSRIAPERGDRRFSDPTWQHNPLWRRLMQSYLVEREAAHRVIDELELDKKSRVRAHFAMSLVTEALAPTNNILTNPNAMAKAAQTRGQSLVAGARNFAHDCATTAACRRRSTRARSRWAATPPSRPAASCTAPTCTS
jgi:polyhydroxyalkanoate synthase